METIKDKQYSDQQISDHKQKLDDPEQAAAALVQVTHQIVDRHITAGVRFSVIGAIVLSRVSEKYP